MIYYNCFIGGKEMKRIIIGLVLFLCTFSLFAQETDNTYWYKEVDLGGRLLTCYFCKTDAQFDNTFKDIVNEQLGITYSFREPNWNSIKSGLVSIEYIKKNFQKFYNCMVDGLVDNMVKYSDYKYCWCIQNINDMYFIKVATRINGTVYISLSIMYGYYQWAYTLETLEKIESLL